MGRKFKNFDEHRAAYDTVGFALFDKDYELPSDPPVGPILAIWKDRIEGRNLDPIDALASIGLGRANVDELIEKGLGAQTMNDLVDWILEAYGFDQEVAKATLADGARAPGTLPSDYVSDIMDRAEKRADPNLRPVR